MEKDTLQQRLEILASSFPVGVKVCNYKVGTVGEVSGEPFLDLRSQRIFIPVTYEKEHLEDSEMIFTVKTVKKGIHRNT